MILRASKKFFQETLQKVKSFFVGGYERLPKSPQLNPFSCNGGADMSFSQSYRELDKFYTDFTNQWDSDPDKAKKRSKRKTISTSSASKYDDEAPSQHLMKIPAKVSPLKNYQVQRREDIKDTSVHQGSRMEKRSKVGREERNCLVAQKLKDLEMLDVSNVDHVLDIEEVLHYYSRLTCPAYLDIVDKFLMDMYSELLNLQASTTHSYSNRTPRTRLQY